MGLHFLEKGVLIRKLKPVSWDDVKHDGVQKWRSPDHHFYLAYLATPVGGSIYLHALLKSLENDEKGIDLCVPDLGWFVQYVEKRNQTRRPLLEWDLNVQSIEIDFEGHTHCLQVGPKGKKVRLFAAGHISQADFQILLHLSGDFVAVRGNQSFTEAISSGKPFFYDGRDHSRSFIKDLHAIAENRIRNCQSALECIRGNVQAFRYHLPVQEGEWVDETFFQELEDWTTIALKIGMALQDPAALEGFKQLSQIIAAEFSANHFLCHLVQRALCHVQNPELEKFEAEQMTLFTAQLQTFSQMIQNVGKKVTDVKYSSYKSL